ncbi:MAG: hypothetical protein KIT84_21140 [Labilithrix sp.]|nr:hypothetical protein [Labilithrix sp.]MCW5813548.1 hypothetical protein [Labilithrix sp.]
MDRLVWVAWRAFWVGLGASLVIVGQSMFAPAPPPAAADVAAPAVEESAPSQFQVPTIRGGHPIVSQKRARVPHAS